MQSRLHSHVCGTEQQRCHAELHGDYNECPYERLGSNVDARQTR
jgi:hypothetical protein